MTKEEWEASWKAREDALREGSLPGFAIDHCPCCHTPLCGGDPVWHWDGDATTAGYVYAVKCKTCSVDLVGTGRANGESPEQIIWSKA